MQKYVLTEEHRALLPMWRKKWLDNSLRTDPMTEEDRRICREATIDMYRIAGLKEPKVVFVTSPFVMRFAGAYAALIHHCKETGEKPSNEYYTVKNPAFNPTYSQTRAEVLRAVSEAVSIPIPRMLGDDEIESDKDWWILGGCKRASYDLGLGKDGLRVASEAYKMWQGGNQWSGYDAYLSFFQDIAKLDHKEFENYIPWRKLSEHSGPRMVHTEFCIISDRPTHLQVDDQLRQHNDKGPFAKWADGTALYAVHGVFLPRWIIESPDRITPKAIEAERNAEIRRIMCEKYGWERYLKDSKAKLIAHDEKRGSLYLKEMPQGDNIMMLLVINSSPEPDGTFRKYTIPVHHELRPLPDPANPNDTMGEPQEITVHNAVASTFGLRGEDYFPEVET